MEFFYCKNCKKKVVKKQDDKRRAYCSKKCRTLFYRNIEKNKVKIARKSFNENFTVTTFNKTKKSTARISINKILKQADRVIISEWLSRLKIKKVYEDSKIYFWRNGCHVSRTITCLTISIKELEKIINHVEKKLKKTGNQSYVYSIKKLKGFRLEVLSYLKKEKIEKR